MVPWLHYVRHEPSQGFDPAERMSPQSVDNTLRAKAFLSWAPFSPTEPIEGGDGHSPVRGRNCFLFRCTIVGTTQAVYILPSRLLMTFLFSY